MSWKPPKRTLQNVPKVKLNYQHPLPERVDDLTPVNDFVRTSQNHTLFQNNGSCVFSDFNTLAVPPYALDDGYQDRFDKTPVFYQGDDSDLEHMLLSEFGGTESSSLDNSSASFLSWTDDFEAQGAAKTRELFEELEMALYDENTEIVKDEDLSGECFKWKNSHIYLRVIGKKPLYIQGISEHSSELENECGDADGEILASHGVIEEPHKIEKAADSGDSISTPSSSHTESLIDKVKVSVLEQLTLYALSEALKSFENDQFKEQVETRENNFAQPVDPVSTLANLSNDLGRALQISGRSIYRHPKVFNSDFGRKSVLSSPDNVQLDGQSKRFLSNINVIPEEKIGISPDNSFSVLGVPKPLNSEFFNSKTKMLEKRGFRSAADRRRPSILNRRFSCISPEHEKLLKPSHENEDNESQSLVPANSKQISAPNTPLKLLRHLTLPPIQNLNSNKKIIENSDEPGQPSLTHIRRIFVKNKVSLSPLPNAVNVSEGGLSELQLAKKLLDSTPDSGRWTSYRNLGSSGKQNVKSRKKGIEKFVYKPRN